MNQLKVNTILEKLVSWRSQPAWWLDGVAAALRTALAEGAPAQGDEPNIGVGVDVTTEGTHVTVAHRAGAVDRIIYSEFHAAPPALTQPESNTLDFKRELNAQVHILAGYFHDGSAETVKFCPDDATRTWQVYVGDKHIGWGDTPAAAMKDAIERQGQNHVGY